MNTSTPADLHVRLTLAQSSLVLEALMEQPFKKVFEIIGSLNQQAQQFYQSPADKNNAQLFLISKNDFATCIKALGELPYNRVSGLIQNLHQQLHTQLFATDAAGDDAGATKVVVDTETVS